MAPRLRRNFQTFELPPHPDYRDGYWLVKRRTLRKTPAPGYGPGKHFHDEWDVCLKLAPETARKTGRTFSKPLTPLASLNQHGRYDLTLSLVKKGQPSATHKTTYCHVVVMALLKTDRNTAGRPCKAHYVDPEDHACYAADHDPVGDQCDCRLDNLLLRHVDEHNSTKRMGWSRTSLPAAKRGVLRPKTQLKGKRREQMREKPAAQQRRGVTWRETPYGHRIQEHTSFIIFFSTHARTHSLTQPLTHLPVCTS
jgi:hypothetical protein